MQIDSTEENDASATPEPTSSPTGTYLESGTRRTGITMRASSPAKRSASERDDDENAHANSTTPPNNRNEHRSPKKTYQEHLSPMPSRFKPANEAARVQWAVSGNVDSRPGADDQIDPQSVSGSDISGPSNQDAEMSNVSGTSSPPTSTELESEPPGKLKGSVQDTPSLDEQVSIIKDIVAKTQLEDGGKGYIISNTWLMRVMARTTQGLHEGHPKSLREGDIGPVDNSSIVANGHFHGIIKDSAGEPFIPLRPGVSTTGDVEIVPSEAWDLIVKWYGVAEASHTIVRQIRNTSPPGAPENLMYELYPPIFTIQKVRNDTEGLSIQSLKEKDLPAVNLVMSRQNLYQNLVKHAKSAAGIGVATKVRVWKLVEPPQASDGRSGMPTPISSRSNSPAPQANLSKISPKLVVDLQAFIALNEGTQREMISDKNEMANEKSIGLTPLGVVGFQDEQTLILEEHIRETDEFVSDKLRKTAAQTGVGLAVDRSRSGPGSNLSQAKTNAASTGSAARRSPTPSGVMTRTNKKGKTRGTTGLTNLGNTCYMNSALQCIRSVEELTLYFLEGKAKSEINADNPLGYRGAIAKAYEGFLHSVYDTDAVPNFAPRNFKATLGRCQPLFSGYGQQDSQEFLSFLVDGLHEDLNRVLMKPYRENPESDDKTVHDPEAIRQLGDKYRESHKARNNSIAMDLFSGFYKNTMVCPVCDKISITFDPYSLLTLQLPIESTFQHQFMFVPLHGRPITINVDMDKNSNIHMLKEYIAKRIPGTKVENLVVTEQYNRKFYKVFEEAEVLSEAQIQQNDKLNIYELDAPPTNWPPLQKKKIKLVPKSSESKSSEEDAGSAETRVSDRLAVPIIHRFSDRTGSDFVLQPGMILLTREEAKDMEVIFRKVLRSISVLTTRDLARFDEPPTHGSDSNEGSEDAVIMNIEETSADDQQIQDKSVEGEDGLVDVSMTGTRDSSGSDAPSEEKKVGPSTMKSRLVDPNHFLDFGLRNLFTLQYYTSRDDPIPCGFSTVNASDRFPLIQSRMPRPVVRRNSSNSWTSRAQDRSTPISSDDELGRENSTSDILNAQDSPPSDSDDSNNIVGDNRSFSQRLGISRKKKLTPQLKKPSRRGSNGLPQIESLIRLGEGIVCTWNRDGFAQLFEGNTSEDMRGRYTIDDMKVLDDPELEARKARRIARKKQGVTLAECFEETSKSEVLSEENAWYCGRCKELRRATKTLEIWTVPDILVVHLKRFSSSSRLRDKVDVFVDFPTEGLDLTGKVGLPEDKSLTYDLFAVDNHYGGLGGGHYTAYAQNFFDKKWYEYNDSMIHQTSPQHVVTKAAYLLFYRRRSNAPLGPPYLQDIVNHAWDGSYSPRSGEDQRRDGSTSPNGSSGSSIEAAAGANHQEDAQHLLGSAGGLESTARSALAGNEGQQHLHDEQLPPYSSHTDDEGIGGMDDDPDNPLPGLEDRQHQQEQGGIMTRFIGPLQAQDRFNDPGGWSFASLPGGNDGGLTSEHAQAGSDNENENDNTADSDCTLAGSPNSNAPMVGDDLVEDRMLDFAHINADDEDEHFVDAGEHFSQHADDPEDDDIYGMNVGGHNVTHVEVKSLVDEHGESEGEVAEVRVSDEDEGA